VSAHTLSALYYPGSVDAALVKAVAAEGVVLAGGLHPLLKAKYFRVGHMGGVTKSDLVTTVSALERGLKACGHPVELGRGVAALG
jgi:alanine-glyoxylate transaminase/serine-glyoxylate transaminase/serine-pyruvate transaminase